MVTYGAEVMNIIQEDEEKLRRSERRILKTVLGSIKVNENEFRSRMNFELTREIRGQGPRFNKIYERPKNKMVRT